MKTIYNLIIALGFITNTAMLSAQTKIPDFNITSPSVDDMNIASTFTKTGDSFIWTQNNGKTSRTTTFSIDTLTGSWDEEGAMGMQTLGIGLNGYQAEFVLIGDATGLSVTLKLIDGDPKTEDVVFNFNINAITYMRYLQQLLPIKLICTIALFVGFSSFGLAQNLTGPTTVTPNSTHTYEYDGGLFLFGWTVVGGNAISSSTSGTIYYATIQWGAAGPGSVTFDNFGTPLETLNVTISEPGGGGGGSPNTGFGNENYVHSLIPRIETTDVTTLNNDEKIESITYFDGLGRAKQSIAIRAGGNQEDIVNHSEYDQYGRMAKEYLPFAQANNAGSLISNALSATNSFYNTIKYENTTNPFSEKDFESSPLNRVFKQAAPGYDWRMGGGHEIEMNYLANTANEVRRYTVSLSFANNTYTPTLVLSSGYYTAGELYKSVTEDENHTSGNNHTTQEFKDSEGRVILKRTYNANVAHDTYYVYDIYGNLGYVLPPKSEPQSAKPDATELPIQVRP